jgi:predicted nucleic acid-binding protein
LFALDRDDAHHQRAARTFGELRGSRLMTHSYVVVESVALTQSRLGAAALRRLCNDLLGVIEVVWVGAELHRAALAALLASDSLSVSFVDWVSFAFMREHGISEALAFDQHFARQGFVQPRL